MTNRRPSSKAYGMEKKNWQTITKRSSAILVFFPDKTGKKESERAFWRTFHLKMINITERKDDFNLNFQLRKWKLLFETNLKKKERERERERGRKKCKLYQRESHAWYIERGRGRKPHWDSLVPLSISFTDSWEFFFLFSKLEPNERTRWRENCTQKHRS